MTNRKVPTQYEIEAIAEHAMRRLFQASGRDWEEFGPADAQRRDWLEQALVMETEAAESLNAERADWKAPRHASIKPVATPPTARVTPRALQTKVGDQLADSLEGVEING